MANAQNDKKTEITFKTIERLRGAAPLVQEVIKAATSYQKSCLKVSESGKQLADATFRLGQFVQGDLGDGILKIAEAHRSVENKRDALCRSLQEDLINVLQRNLKPEEVELNQFESEYKKMRSKYKEAITKLEGNCKKLGKKGPDALQQAITALNDKIKEFETQKGEKLRNVLLLERKKYCTFVGCWVAVVSQEIDLHVNEGNRLQQEQNGWKNLASSVSQIPQQVEEVISKTSQERTFVQIQSDSSYSSQYDYSPYDDNSSPSYYDNSYSSQSYGSYVGTCTALYDYKASQPEDLSIFAGDVINVIQRDDGSGWMKGELNGKEGIFPASYVRVN